MQDNDSSPNDSQGPGARSGYDDWLNAAAAWWSQALSEAGGAFRARLDAQAKRPLAAYAGPGAAERVDPNAFNQHVVPDLQAVIRSYACFIRLRMHSYPEAFDGCMAYAWRRGAWGFNPTHLHELHDWLHDQLTLAIGPER